MSFTKLFLLCATPLLVLGAKIQRATPTEFGLFGYGPGFGGFPLFYANGKQNAHNYTAHLTVYRVRVLG